MQNENPEVTRIQEVTRKLEALNRDIDHLLSRLPLQSYLDVARLNQLVNEQFRISSLPPKRELPPRIMIFYENARDRASFLRQRYNEALSSGTLRKANGMNP